VRGLGETVEEVDGEELKSVNMKDNESPSAEKRYQEVRY
jgi:hypothetical protein